jgi:hypothetical protein
MNPQNGFNHVNLKCYVSFNSIMNPDSMEHSHEECSVVHMVNKFTALWNPYVYYLDYNGSLMDTILDYIMTAQIIHVSTEFF